MTTYFYKNIPNHNLNSFLPVRDVFDNLFNIVSLVEIVKMYQKCLSLEYVEDFDFAVFSGNFNRALVRKNDGFFTMSIPFQVIDRGEGLSFNFDPIGGEVGGLFLSIVRNAITASKNSNISCDDIVLSISETFGLNVSDSIMYCDAFFSLIADDHGYFRFDDDPENVNDDLHPRFHFDFFYKNTSSIKIGLENQVDIDCFYSLFDKMKPKMYLRK